MKGRVPETLEPPLATPCRDDLNFADLPLLSQSYHQLLRRLYSKPQVNKWDLPYVEDYGVKPNMANTNPVPLKGDPIHLISLSV